MSAAWPGPLPRWSPRRCRDDRLRGEGQAQDVPSAAPLCRPLSARVIGPVDDSAATELSGLVASRTQAGVLWTHNDSGDSARVIAIRLDGSSLGSFPVTGAAGATTGRTSRPVPRPAPGAPTSTPATSATTCERRATIVVYRFPEPDASRGARPTAPATTADAALSRRLARRRGAAGRPAHRRPRDRHQGVQRQIGRVRGACRLAAARSAIGLRRAAHHRARLRAHGDRRRRRPRMARRSLCAAMTGSSCGSDVQGESLARTLARGPCSSPTLLDEGQGEALALVEGGRAALTVTEGGRPPLRRYTPEKGVLTRPNGGPRQPQGSLFATRVYWPHAAATGGSSACKKWSSTG